MNVKEAVAADIRAYQTGKYKAYGSGKLRAESNYKNATYTPPEQKYSFSALRTRAIGMRDAILEKKKENAALHEKYSHIYAPEYLKKMDDKAKAEMTELIATCQTALRKDLENIMTARQERIEEYFSATPSRDVIDYLQLMQMRTKLSESDVDGMLKKCGTNYQALCVARDLAEKSGLVFSLPLNQDKSEQTMAELNEMCDKMILAVADEDYTLDRSGAKWIFKGTNYDLNTDFSSLTKEQMDERIDYTDRMFYDADLDPAIALSDPKTLLQRINDGLNKAVKEENEERYRDISRFAVENADSLKTEKDVEIEQKQTAERLEAEAESLGI